MPLDTDAIAELGESARTAMRVWHLPEDSVQDQLAALENRLLDLEQRNRNCIVIRWPRGVPINGELLTQIRDNAFDRVVVEL